MSDEDEGAKDAALPEDCVITDTGDGEDDGFHPFDEVEDAYQPAPAMRVMENGLPRTVDQTTASDIPALSEASLICLGDYSRFVIRNRWRDEIASFERAEVDRAPSGIWRAKLELVAAKMNSNEKLSAEFLEGEARGKLYDAGVRSDNDWVEVEPVRPPCRHYVMQKTQFKYNAQAEYFPRLCAARRTTEGTFMTVGETGMWACSMREPRHLESEAELEAFDRKKMEQGRTRQHLPLFGGGIGIFDSRETPQVPKG
jgi:hypothetical protein